MAARIKLRVKVHKIIDGGMMLEDESGELYYWFTNSFRSKLFHSADNRWFMVSTAMYMFDHPTPKNGLKNVRILKEN